MKTGKVEVTVEYDEHTDVAYIDFVQSSEETRKVIFTAEANATVSVDFGPKSIIHGIEVLGASQHLPSQMLL